jgi:hypothetical protein
MLKHWVVLMGSAAFTFIGIYAAATNQGNEWIVRASFSMAVLVLLVASFLAWKEKAKELSGATAELNEERSVKNAPQLMLHYGHGALGGVLEIENVSAGKHACKINFAPLTRNGFTALADPIQFLESGARHPLPIYLERGGERHSYDVREPVGGWGRSDPFKVEILISLEYTDPLGTTTYIAKFLWIGDRLLDPVIESVGVTTKAMKHDSERS